MPEALNSRRREQWLPALLLLIVIGIASAWYLTQRNTFHEFAALEGPEQPSVLTTHHTSWTTYQEGTASRLAILLTDENSAWLGIAHGLKSIGVPFRITRSVEEAIEHSVILAYPMIAGSVLSAQELLVLRNHVESGNTLIGSQVLGGGLQDLFGFDSVSESREHVSVAFSADEHSTRWLDHPRERQVLIGDPNDRTTWLGTQAFEGAKRPLAWYDSGKAAVVMGTHRSGGTAYAIGMDLGFLIMRAHNDRNGEAYRDYANGYEPSVDAWLRWLRFIYQQHEPLGVTLNTVPNGQELATVVSFDVDYVHSLEHVPAYREMLTRLEVPATFFIQTKYYRDFQDQGFFNDSSLQTLTDLGRAQMEVGSHSVSHTDVFASLPIGTGTENYPDYQPRVRAMGDTRGASILGELRVSRFLLEQLGNTEVRSFRPGYLAHPRALPQALEAAGYRYSSSVTAGNVTTHLPYRTNANRMYAAETAVYEFPIAIEDEIQPPMDHRIDDALILAGQLRRYGGSFVILVHPDTLGPQFRFLELIIPQLRPYSWFGTIREFGDWWSARDALAVDLMPADGGGVDLTLHAGVPIEGVALTLPSGLIPSGDLPDGVSLEGRNLLVDRIDREPVTIQVVLGAGGE